MIEIIRGVYRPKFLFHDYRDLFKKYSVDTDWYVPQTLGMRIKHLFGVHTWLNTLDFGMFPMKCRKCVICKKIEND